eukprot:Colp12_sorted_trinity150504_noHs@9794
MTRNVLYEDLNVGAKWLQAYSHFYNPKKPNLTVCTLNVYCRYNSSIRVIQLQDDIHNMLAVDPLTSLDVLLDPLAHAVHHIQDMASPPHVVPVMHGLTDGYENYVTADAEPAKGCISKKETPTLVDLLDSTAITTLENIKKPTLKYKQQGKDFESDWSKFWKEASDDVSFGEYGDFGNEVGSKEFKSVDGTPTIVKTEVYVSFKAQQMRLAVDSTVAALRWLQATVANRKR